jgi:hypothetical protein
MKQNTLQNIHTEICPTCKKAMQLISLSDCPIFWCPNCSSVWEYKICLKCGNVFKQDGYATCIDCREKAIMFLEEKENGN